MTRELALLIAVTVLSFALGVALGATMEHDSHHCPAQPVREEDFRP